MKTKGHEKYFYCHDQGEVDLP